jgi:hypothetical protein
VYTPQTIVNGNAEFVGSDVRRLDSEVDKALAKPAGTSVAMTQSPWTTGGPVKVNAVVASAPAGSVLCAALCEDGLLTDVKRGENGGHKLAHDGVVRSYSVSDIPSDGKVSVTLKAPLDIDASRARVVLYVQDAKTLAITGAAMSRLVIEKKDEPKQAEVPLDKTAPAK